MFDIPEERLNEIQDIVSKAAANCETVDDVTEYITNEFLEPDELCTAMYVLGRMASTTRNDIVVNATMMMLGGIPVTDGMEILTTVMVNTIRAVNDHEAQVQLVDITKKILDTIVGDPVDHRLN